MLSLHISPWNYPFPLVFTPIIGAIAAGNTVVVKPSELAPHTADCIEKIIKLASPEWGLLYKAVRKWKITACDKDYIMYTGAFVSPKLSRKQPQSTSPLRCSSSAENPVLLIILLEFGLARRIIFGKFLNCGQTCIAPDYILVHESVKESLIAAMIASIKSYGGDESKSDDYGHHQHSPF